MRFSSTAPRLTVEEAKRFWLPPVDVCNLAAIGHHSEPGIKKFLNNLSDQRLVPFEKSGEKKTNPRHYSLVSALMLRVIVEVTKTGRSYKYAKPIAEQAGNLLLYIIQNCENDYDENAAFQNGAILYSDITSEGLPRKITVSIAENPMTQTKGHFSYDYGVLDASSMIERILHLYWEEYWSGYLEERGLLEPMPRREIGPDGWPVEGGS